MTPTQPSVRGSWHIQDDDCLDEDTIAALTAGEIADTDRARALDHLESCEVCTEWLAQLLRCAPRPTPRTPPMAPPLEPATVFAGRYIIVRLIGRGGMGEVYAATDRQLERTVALKLLSAHDRSDRAVQRLVRESKAMARLSHPNVIPVFDAGNHDGVPYVAMEFVDGPTVGVWSRGRPWREVATAFGDVARGLAAAHGAGLIHRDIKPDNILVRSDGRAVLGDFGLATAGQRTDGDGGDDDSEASDGVTHAAGTVAYMAPEQLCGDPADARSDIFGLSAALYECLYQTLPFAASTPAEQLRAVEQRRLQTPPRATKVPRAMLRLLRRGLSPVPTERFATAGTMARALTKLVRRRRVRTTAALAGTAGLLGFAGWMRSTDLPEDCERTGARVAEAWAPAQQSRILAMRGGAPLHAALDRYAASWTDAVERTCAWRTSGTQTDATYQLESSCLDRALVRFATFVTIVGDEGDDPLRALQGAERLPSVARCTMGADQSEVRPMPRGADQQRRVQATRGTLAGAQAALFAGALSRAQHDVDLLRTEAEAIGYRPLQAEVLNLAAVVAREQGQLADSRQFALAAMNAAVAGSDDESAVVALVDLAGDATDAGEFDRASEYVDRAAAVGERIGAPGGQLRAALASARGRIALATGALGEAESLYREALTLAAPDHPSRDGFYEGLSGALQLQGRNAEAFAVADEALADRIDRYGPDHPFVALSLMNLGGMLWSQGRADEALPLVERALRIADASMPDSPRLASLRDLRGGVLGDLGRVDEALAEHAQARAIFERTLGPTHELVADNLAYEAEIHARQGAFATAIPLLQRALAIQISIAPDHPARYHLATSLGDALGKSGALPASENLLTETVAGLRGIDGDPFLLGVALSRLAETRFALGESQPALGTVDEAIALLDQAQGDPAERNVAHALRSTIVAREH